jgi:metal-sulfur cluster biosynthetic enzyme
MQPFESSAGQILSGLPCCPLQTPELLLAGPPEALMRALDALRKVQDPDVGANIVELGLVESLRLSVGEARLQLVTTGPDCPLSDFSADRAMRAMQGALPDTDIFVSHDPWVEWEPRRASLALRKRFGWSDA